MKKLNENDAVTIFNLDENKKNYNIYLDEINKKNKEIKESEKEYFSKKIEEIIATEFLVRTGKKVRKNNKILVSEEIPYITANVNRRLINEKSFLECIVSSNKNIVFGSFKPITFSINCSIFLNSFLYYIYCTKTSYLKSPPFNQP